MLATDAAGNVVWKETYRPYGDRLNKQAASSNNKLWFAGKPQDANTGRTSEKSAYSRGFVLPVWFRLCQLGRVRCIAAAGGATAPCCSTVC